jgi:hypothetical protein
MTRRTRDSDARKFFASALLVSLAWQTLPISPAFAAKKPLSVPVYSQLNQGAGPETHDVGQADQADATVKTTASADTPTATETPTPAETTAEASPATAAATAPSGSEAGTETSAASTSTATAEASGSTSGAAEKSDMASAATPASPSIDLSPVRLDSPAAASKAADTKASADPAKTDGAASSESTAAASTEASADAGSTVLNATVNRDEFVPKAPVDRTDLVVGEPVKKDTKKEATAKQEKDLGRKLGPLQLQETDNETSAKTLTVVDAEKSELADLWDAALSRNQDIQFVVQKLMPSKDPKHTTAMMMKLLSTAMYGAMSASTMMMPGGTSAGQMQGMYMAQNAGAGLVMNVLNGAASKSARKAQVTETEAIMLYNIIRNVADKVVENFHEYKKNRTNVDRGYTDYQDLQNMVADARAAQDPAKQIEMEYTLRKARRDIDALNDDVRRSRQSLVDLAGAESIDRLDKQVQIENDKVDDGTEIATPDAAPAGAADAAPIAEKPEPEKSSGPFKDPRTKKDPQM